MSDPSTAVQLEQRFREQLAAIAYNLCQCVPPCASIDPDDHGSFCAFHVASTAVDGRAVLATPPLNLVRVPCEFCAEGLHVPSGVEGVGMLVRGGWEAVADHAWCCPACAESRERATLGDV